MKPKEYALYELRRRYIQKNQYLLVGHMAETKKDTESANPVSSGKKSGEIELQRECNTKEEG